MLNLSDLVAGYAASCRSAGLTPPVGLKLETLTAPHSPHALPKGFGAVYVFALTDGYRAGEVAPGRALKVGKAGPTSNARFQSQHYSATSAPSTLSRSLVETPVLWPLLGVDEMSAGTVRDWLLVNTDRHHVFLPADEYPLHGTLVEKYLRGVLGPVFEG